MAPIIFSLDRQPPARHTGRGALGAALLAFALVMPALASADDNHLGMKLSWKPDIVEQGEKVRVQVHLNAGSEGAWYTDLEGLKFLRGWHQKSGFCPIAEKPCLQENEDWSESTILSYSDCCYTLYCLSCFWSSGHEFSPAWYGPPTWEFEATGCNWGKLTAQYYDGSHGGPYRTEEIRIPIRATGDAEFVTEPAEPVFCAGEPMKFIDVSCGEADIVSRTWTFTLGTEFTGYAYGKEVEPSFQEPGHYLVNLEVVTANGGTLTTVDTFEVVDTCAAVAGEVLWFDPSLATTRALRGATVAAAGTSRETSSSTDGSYLLRLPPGDYTIEATAAGFSAFVTGDPPLPTNVVDVSLEEGDVVNESFLLLPDGVDPADVREALGIAWQEILDPINPAIGNVSYRKQLFAFPATGLPFAFSVFYNSLAHEEDGVLGWGWSHSYDIRLEQDGDEVSVRWGDGRRDFFAYDADSDSYPQVRGQSELELEALNPSGWQITDRAGLVFDFDEFGRLLFISDRNGNQNSFSHSTQLDQISDAAGRLIELHYAAGRLSSITSPLKSGDTVAFVQDGNGDLTTIVDPRGNSWGFGYDSAHRLLTEVDAKGATVATNSYDAEGRVVEQLDCFGAATTLSYSSADLLHERVTTVSYPSGKQASFSYSPAFDLTASTDGSGENAEMRYDQAGRLVELFDKRGAAAHFGYDDDGNPVELEDRSGGLWQLSYNAASSPITVQNPAGGTTRMSYDTKQNLTRLVDAAGGQYDIGYDASGRPLTVRANTGGTWSRSYNAQGLVDTLTTPAGGVTTATYSAAGWPTRVRRPDGGEWSFSYDHNGNLVGATDPLGQSATMTYDANNNMEAAVLPCGAGETATTTYEYDAWVAPRNRTTKITDALGGESTTVYHPDGNMPTEVTDADGVIWQFSYNEANLAASTTDPAGQTTTFAYDANGNLTSRTDALGHSWTFRYDAEDRLVEVEDPLGHSRVIERDVAGRRRVLTDAEERSTVFIRDQRGRILITVRANGDTESRSYDAIGNLASISDGLGRSWQLEYDSSNRLVARRDPSGRAESYEYDAADRLLRFTSRAGRELDFDHDLLGRVISVQYPEGTLGFAYDDAGNVDVVSDTSGATSMGYDKLGRRLSRTDSFGNGVGFGYTLAGRLISVSYPGGRTISREHDAAGRLWRLTDWLGNITTYSYDALSRVSRIDLPNGSYTEYGYDAAGRLSSLQHKRSDDSVLLGYALTRNRAGQIVSVERSGSLAESFADLATAAIHDEVNRLTSELGETATATFEHDRDGYLVSRSAPGESTRYSYDGLGRLLSVEANGELTSYSYDGLGNRISKTEGGVTTRYVGDPLRPYFTTDAAGTITRSFVSGERVLYSLDAAGAISVLHGDWLGNVVAVTDGAEAVTLARSYGPYGRELARVGTLDLELGFQGLWGCFSDANGLVHMHARVFDPARKRFLSEDPLGLAAGTNLYAFVGGDPANRIDPWGTADDSTDAGVAHEDWREGFAPVFDHVQFWGANVTGPVVQWLKVLPDGPLFKVLGPLDTAVNLGKLDGSVIAYRDGEGPLSDIVHDSAASLNSGIGLIPLVGQLWGLTYGMVISSADYISPYVFPIFWKPSYQLLSKEGDEAFRAISPDPPPIPGPLKDIYMMTINLTPVGMQNEIADAYIKRNLMLGDELSLWEVIQHGNRQWWAQTKGYFGPMFGY